MLFFPYVLIWDGVVIRKLVLGNPVIGCILFSSFSSHFSFCLCHTFFFFSWLRKGFHD